jgi:hypothetical protein
VCSSDLAQTVTIYKISETGSLKWSKSVAAVNSAYGLGGIQSLNETTDGGVILSAFLGVDDVLEGSHLARLSAKGAVSWEREYFDEYFRGAKQTADGGYILVGTDAVFNGDYIGLKMSKLDANYAEQWYKTLTPDTTGFTIYGYDIIQTSDGGYLSGGLRSSDATGSEIWLMKRNNFGNPNG